MNDDRQTLLGVIGSILFAIVVYMATSLLLFDATPSGEWAVQRVYSGSSLAITMVALRYHRLPAERRLPPAHAIGLGGLQMIMTSWLMITAPALVDRRWLAVIGLVLLAAPGIYLMVMGVRAVRAAGVEAKG